MLGPVEVRRDGRLVPVPGGKTVELLARLALDAGVPVRADRLVDELWQGAAISRNTLQSKVARLRRALGDAQAIGSGDGTYVLHVDPGQVDALRVIRDAGTASQRLAAGDEGDAAAVSAAALACFRGPLLEPAGDWAVPYRARLEDARVQLLETNLAARASLGDPAIGELESAVTEHPYRERLWELLITALYGAGRQADALAAHRRVRDRLREELGMEPGPRLKELERRVLQQDPALNVSDRPVATGNLPALASELVGRDAELAALAEQLRDRRLVEVVGPGGIGKTAVAIAAGRAMAGPDCTVWLARLESTSASGDVLDTVIAALGVAGGEAALLERLRRGATLLILDNCEHVADAAAELAERLLGACAGLRILCTSQVALGLDGEVVLELAPLAPADAVRLFTQRASRHGDLDEVRELCRALDGLPLAIELAAARTRTLSVAEISRRLDDRFSLLRDPTSRKPERRRALRATIGWSYELLFPDDKQGLWALSTFTGGASLDAFESVIGALDVPASAAIDVIGRLAGRSLLIVDGEDVPRRATGCSTASGRSPSRR